MKWHSFPAVRWALFRIRGPSSYVMTSGSSSYSVSWLCKKKKLVNLQIIQCGSIFISFFPCLLKKLQKRERTCRAYMKVMERRFRPTLLAPPLPTFFLRCRVDLSPSSAACSLCTVMYSPPPPRASFSFCICIYICVCFYCLMRAGTHLVLSEGGWEGLIYAVVPVCFPSQRETTAVNFCCPSRCSLLCLSCTCLPRDCTCGWLRLLLFLLYIFP